MNRLPRNEIKRLLCQSLDKKINQDVVEKWSSTFWSLSRSENADTSSRSFVMMLPPPNITGNLHLGHALTASIQDALLRQRKMRGFKTVWIPGFDHAGIATQMIVEKILWTQEGLTRKDLSRELLVERANQWKDSKRQEMRTQLDRLGLELDYNREYFTMDFKSSLAVQTAFKKLFNAGIIYRSIKEVYWSPEAATTLSDIEVENVGGVTRSIRTGEQVERQPKSQWFVSASSLAHEAVKVVNEGSISMIPPNYKNTYTSWLLGNGVEDWCISRQNWWGHRIPAYKLKSTQDTQDNWIVADSIKDAQLHLGEDVIQDPDILDTWFSSSLLPLTITGWPDKELFSESNKNGLFPLDIMETGFDILNFWVSKMVMMSLALEKKIPFKLVLLHGMICDSNGKKMSKSLGNVIDPLDVIDGTNLKKLQERSKLSREQGIFDDKQLESVMANQKKLFPTGIPACGADGLRAYLLSQDFQEEIVKVRIDQIDKIRRLSNKIWNIFRFLFTILENEKIQIDVSCSGLCNLELCELDRQVLSDLAKCVKSSHRSFHETFFLHHSLNDLEQFWSIQLSSNYIEKCKSTLFGKSGTPEERETKFRVIVECLITAIKLQHPFMPHLTEFLYQKLCQMANRIDADKLEEVEQLSTKSFPEVDVWSRYEKVDASGSE